MAVTIRLARRGQTHRPFYHIVATDSRNPRDGRFLDKIGTYNPVGNKEVSVDAEKARLWLGRGAVVSNVVKTLCKNEGGYNPAAAESAEAAPVEATPAAEPKAEAEPAAEPEA